MMHRRLLHSRLSILMASLLILGWSCKDSTAVQVTPELLAQYESLSHPTSAGKMEANIDCFLDFSTGMGEGMRATAAINDQLKNFLGGRTVTCYRVGAQDSPPVVALGSPEANFVDLKNFKEAGSKLKVAVDRMTAQKNRVSFFITDFERVDDVSLRQNLPGASAPHPIDASAWAQTAFREWLSNGNQIDIFAVPFQKPDFWFDPSHKRTYANWIYTIVLTPRAIATDSSTFKTSVAGFLQEQYRNNAPPGAHQLIYSAAAVDVARSTKTASGNANPAIIVQDSSTAAFDKGYEFYAFTTADLLKFAEDAAIKDKRLLVLHVVSNIAFLTDAKYSITVNDVTQALTDMDKVTHQGAPEIRKDVETGKADTVANKPLTAKYDQGTTDEATFDAVYNPETKELGIKLKPDFSGVKEHTIYKIDVIIVSSTLVEHQDEDAVLTLQYAGGYRIRPLGESIHLALRDVAAQMNKRTLHTVYIDITP